ncbi:MAG: carboxypeptidase-like regulatory domain-containing protein [Bacteroidales bacterium]|nr:carboxypeptidase-like regulatory domain-containing protein [Bacteroidales bacterium]
MKKILFLTLIFSVSTLCFAGNDKGSDSSGERPANGPVPTLSISGVVKDIDSGEMLTGVEIMIDGTGLKAYTDLDGRFTFKTMTPGTYTLIASFISYKNSLIENMEVTGSNQELEIKLKADD